MRRYSDEFKLTAVRLSQQPGVQVQTVATAFAIHPFMLSKWRKDVKDERLRGRPPKARSNKGTRRSRVQLRIVMRTFPEIIVDPQPPKWFGLRTHSDLSAFKRPEASDGDVPVRPKPSTVTLEPRDRGISGLFKMWKEEDLLQIVL